VALAGTKLDLCRQRVQQDTRGHRGRSGDPLYRVRRTLRTRTELLTSKQKARLAAVFAADEHIAVEVTWQIYHRSSPHTPTPTHATARRCWPGRSTTSEPAYQPGSRNWPPSDGPCIGDAMTSWPT